MWSDQGGEDGSFDGNDGRSEDSFLFLNVDMDTRRERTAIKFADGEDGDDEAEQSGKEDFGWIVDDEDVEDEMVWMDESEDDRMEDAKDLKYQRRAGAECWEDIPMEDVV